MASPSTVKKLNHLKKRVLDFTLSLSMLLFQSYFRCEYSKVVCTFNLEKERYALFKKKLDDLFDYHRN